MTRSIRPAVTLIALALIAISGAADLAADASESQDTVRRAADSGGDDTMQQQGSDSHESSLDYSQSELEGESGNSNGNSAMDYDQDLDFESGSTGDTNQPHGQNTQSGTSNSNGDSMLKGEVEKLSGELRELESQVSQQGGAGSSSQMKQLEKKVQRVESGLQKVADQIEGRVSELSETEGQLEKQLYKEMKRIEDELRRLQKMTHAKMGHNKEVQDSGTPHSNTNADYDLDLDFVPGQSRIAENQNAPSTSPDANQDSSQDYDSNDDVYSADVDYRSDGVELSSAVEAQQVEFAQTRFQAKVIGIIFGSVLGIIIIVAVIFGCFINTLLYIKKRQSGSKAESASLTTM